ncbi:MAG: TlpA family protein disulfide reductase [Candidatus Wallbacteria bacterium]|nr:TlpA family protein disulfide reductase [Candidatus Wallbacteria bacterium]MBI4868302.1 TlpA family protein disulfide reductase [Candidatus Wallbacteria bacterium]
MHRRSFLRTGSLIGGLAALLAMACLLPTAWAGNPSPADLIGQPAPLFTGKLMDGTVVNLEDLRGRVVVLDFWATWCSYCRDAIPKVQAVARRFENSPVTLVGINLDRDRTPEQIAEFLKRYGISFGQILDPDAHVKKKYLVRGIPCAVVIDKQGVVKSVHIGDDAELEQKLGGQVASLL